jgi:glutamate carboxypeptidase
MTDTPAAALLAWCAAQQSWLLDTIEALVRLESPSTSKAAVDRCGDELSARLRDLGAAVDRIRSAERGNHIVATLRAARDDAPRILLLGHFDTVWDVGQLERMPLRHDPDTRRLYGPGTFDMKAGIGVGMQALRALTASQTSDRPHVTMMWTADEEIGSGTSRSTIESTAREHDAVLVLEPPLAGGGAKTSRKGVGEFELHVTGIPAHAGLDPGKGASAIHELAHQIVAIASLQRVDRGVTVNVGRISGGTRTNVVADAAHAVIDVRVPTMADAVGLIETLRGLTPVIAGTRLELRGGVDRPPLERTAQVVALYEIARTAARALGQDLAEGAAGGGSDGNFTAAIGVPTLDGLGPRGDGAHAVHEHVDIDDLPWRAAFLAELLRRLGEGSQFRRVQ